MIDKLKEELKTLRTTLKAQIQSKNEYFSLKVTTQKKVDLFVSKIKVIETQIKSITAFVTEVEDTIETVENKVKEELATKKVIET